MVEQQYLFCCCSHCCCFRRVFLASPRSATGYTCFVCRPVAVSWLWVCKKIVYILKRWGHQIANFEELLLVIIVYIRTVHSGRHWVLELFWRHWVHRPSKALLRWARIDVFVLTTRLTRWKVVVRVFPKSQFDASYHISLCFQVSQTSSASCASLHHPKGRTLFSCCDSEIYWRSCSRPVSSNGIFSNSNN